MFDLIDENGNIIEDYEGKVYRYIKGGSILYLIYDRVSFKLRAIALNVDYTSDELVQILKNPNKFEFPGTLQEYLKGENDIRDLKVTFYDSKGKSGGSSVGGKIFIPPTWSKLLGLDKDSRDVVATFDGEKIVIKRKG